MFLIYFFMKGVIKLAVSLLLTNVVAASKDKESTFSCLGCAAEYDASKHCRKYTVAGQQCSDA